MTMQINYLFVIISYIMNIVFGSLPISAWNDTSVGGKIQPYNLIDTDTSCYWKGFCPMFPPGGELSAFPNGEEKFQHLLHNLHRMFTNCSRETPLGRYTYGGNTRGGLLKWCTGCRYCGKYVSGRKPLYWYSDANAAARFKQWDEHNCDQDWYKEVGQSPHSTCKWGLSEVVMWGKGITSIVPRDRCALLSSNINQCQFSARGSKFCSDKKDRCWFETEGICAGNSCLIDPHCEPVFAGKYDYVGKGFVGGMNGVDSIYSRFTKEIYYLLPIGAHFDARIHTAPVDYRSDGKYFNLMLEYHDRNSTQTVLNCYALYAGDITEMSVYISGTLESQCSAQYYDKSNEFSVMFYAYYTPHISCEPYSFVCETSKNIFFRLPQQDEYYFGTDWIDWVWSDYSSYGYQECKEQHYYNHPSEGWTVNGGEKLIKSDIWYYHNGGQCIGCEKIGILNCLQDCIYNYNHDITQLQTCKSDCKSGSTQTTQSPTALPSVSPVIKTKKPTQSISPTDTPTTQSPTFQPSKSPVIVTDKPTTYPTVKPTDSPTTQSPTNKATTQKPTFEPSKSPVIIRNKPTQSPTDKPTTQKPTFEPSKSPVLITNKPTNVPTSSPTQKPTQSPTTCEPSVSPTNKIFSPSQTGQTCTSVLNWSYKWTRVLQWDENIVGALYKNVAKGVFIAQHSECGDSNDLEYYYYFSFGVRGLKRPNKRKLWINMLICCGKGKTFGPNYKIPNDIPQKDKYTANSIWMNKYGKQ